MKILKIIAVIGAVLAAMLCMVFVSCDEGAPAAESATYTGFDSANNYELVIIQKVSKAYVPEAGDSYALTITPNGGSPKKSTGTVEKINSNGFDLKPNGGEKFTVTTNSTGGITKIEGNISLDSGGTQPAPTALDDLVLVGTEWVGISLGGYTITLDFTSNTHCEYKQFKDGYGWTTDYTYTVSGNIITLPDNGIHGPQEYKRNGNTMTGGFQHGSYGTESTLLTRI